MSDSQDIAAKIGGGGGGGTPGTPSLDPTPHREAVENGAKRLGLIAGNGRFPFPAPRRGARPGPRRHRRRHPRGDRPRNQPPRRRRPCITVHWLSLGELSRLIEIFHKEGVPRP